IPTVFVVDDDAAVRKSLVRLLTSADYRVESFGSADEFLVRWQEDPVPGCVLLDIMMPGLDGLQLQQVLQTSTHTLPVIFITGHGDVPSSVKAMKAGAIDFFTKPFNDEDLLRAIHEAIQRDHQARSLFEARAAAARRFEKLTSREREVMALVVSGLLNKQIAFELGASVKTIKIHRGRVMAKMKVQSVADLVRAAEMIGIRPDSPPPPA
ncbi:MAG: response regulator transcription factor, partial [Desulfobacterales bacterium]